MSFDPCNCLLKVQKTIGTPTPKVGTHLGVWGFIPSHSPAFSKAWNVTPGLHSWFANLANLYLSREPKVRVVTVLVVFLIYPLCVLIPPWCVPNFYLCTFSLLLYVSIPPWCVFDVFLCTFSFPLGVLHKSSIWVFSFFFYGYLIFPSFVLNPFLCTFNFSLCFPFSTLFQNMCTLFVFGVFIMSNFLIYFFSVFGSLCVQLSLCLGFPLFWLALCLFFRTSSIAFIFRAKTQ